MIDVSIIIVSYNTKEFLKKCLLSIRDNVKKISYEIIVVDNASTDGTAKEISNFIHSKTSLRLQFDSSHRRRSGRAGQEFQISNVKFIENRRNLGFSKANNLGLKASQKSRYVLFLNPDTVVYKNTLEKMVEFMDENKDVGASTCKLEMPNGKIDDASHRGFPTPWNSFCHFSGLSRLFPRSRLFGGYNLGWMDLSKIHEIDVLAGAFMLVRREAGNEANWWDEDYFFYGEDIDFCYSLKEKGWKIYYVPTVSILHYKGVAGGIKSISQKITTATKETRIRSTKARFNAMRIFYKKHYEKKYPKFITQFIYAGISLKERLSSV